MTGPSKLDTIIQLFLYSLLVVFISMVVNYYGSYNEQEEFKEVHKWLIDHKLEKFSKMFKANGFTSLQKVCQLSKMKIAIALKQTWLLSSPVETMSEIDTLSKQIKYLKSELQFKHWLCLHQLQDFETKLNKLNIFTLNDVLENMDKLKVAHSSLMIYSAIVSLEQNKDYIDGFPVTYTYKDALSHVYYICTWLDIAAKSVVVGTIAFVIYVLYNTNFNYGNHLSNIFRTFSQSFSFSHRNNSNSSTTWQQVNKQHSWFTSITGNYFNAEKSLVSWNYVDEEMVVGNEVIITVQFLKRNGLSFPVSSLSSLKVEVIEDTGIRHNNIESTIIYSEKSDSVDVHFMCVKAEKYEISILANGEHVGKSPYTKTLKPGKIDPTKSSLVVPSSLLVLEEGKKELLTFDERDKYGNPCTCTLVDLHKYKFNISQFGCDGKMISPELTFEDDEYNRSKQNKAWITIVQSGIYLATVFYDNEVLSDHVVLLVLTATEIQEVNKNITTPSWTLWYEAYLYSECERSGRSSTVLPPTPSQLSRSPVKRRSASVVNTNPNDWKRKKVYCYITSKFLTIKEFYLKIFPKKLYTFRIEPSVKISLVNLIEDDLECFQIESCCGEVITLYCEQRNILVATFVKLLLKNIGGSECFENKKQYFYDELNKMHSKRDSRVSIKIRREHVVKDTKRAVKYFSQGEWWKKFEISFAGEEGLDYGGLTREWIHLLVKELFHSDGALFRRFNKDDTQALMHPNPFRTEKYQKIKLFELAGLIVGKCLVECSYGSLRQQYIKARFTRSFFAQILGLGANWMHFASDDKEYYSGKIKYILENDPVYLDIYFTEDVYNNENQLVKTVDLKSNGSKIEVTEENKFEYIQRLAFYRLAESVKEEIAAFLKGLYMIVPEGLLSIFDENELELLMCGMDTISVSDLKSNHVHVSGNSFDQMMSWFWTVISGFNQEELSRLLQFATGCSQLPPEGFAGLSPRFQITTAPGVDILPTAHTCFNNLCLPHYTSMEALKTKLLIAITEGSEGFGLV